MTGMDVAWLTGMDVAWKTGMDDWTLLFISYFYILMTDRLTDGLTLVLVKSLSRLKTNVKMIIKWDDPPPHNVKTHISFFSPVLYFTFCLKSINSKGA